VLVRHIGLRARQPHGAAHTRPAGMCERVARAQRLTPML
jgi:hypothetical protein